MTTTLSTLLAAPPSGRDKAAFFDFHDYAESVILQGRQVPWQEPMAYSNFFGQAQGLLKPDAALLSLDRFYAQHLASSARLQTAMSAKSRTGYAVRTLLGDPETTEHAIEFATTFAKTQREPIILNIPSPRQWLSRTHHFSGSTDISRLGADDAENASMYVADWLRGFASLPLTAVMLDDRNLDAISPVPVDLATYSPVANVTDHYRWALGLRGEDSVELRDNPMVGGVITNGFWFEDNYQLPAGDFFLSEIPPTAIPENVLTRISSLARPK